MQVADLQGANLETNFLHFRAVKGVSVNEQTARLLLNPVSLPLLKLLGDHVYGNGALVVNKLTKFLALGDLLNQVLMINWSGCPNTCTITGGVALLRGCSGCIVRLAERGWIRAAPTCPSRRRLRLSASTRRNH